MGLGKALGRCAVGSREKSDEEADPHRSCRCRCCCCCRRYGWTSSSIGCTTGCDLMNRNKRPAEKTSGDFLVRSSPLTRLVALFRIVGLGPSPPVSQQKAPLPAFCNRPSQAELKPSSGVLTQDGVQVAIPFRLERNALARREPPEFH